MSASSRLRLGAVSAAMLCSLLSYAVAQQTTTNEQLQTDPNAASQADRAAIEQADPAAPGISTRPAGELNQNRTNYRAAQAAVGHNPVEHFLAACLLQHNKAEVELSQIALQRSEN